MQVLKGERAKPRFWRWNNVWVSEENKFFLIHLPLHWLNELRKILSYLLRETENKKCSKWAIKRNRLKTTLQMRTKFYDGLNNNKFLSIWTSQLQILCFFLLYRSMRCTRLYQKHKDFFIFTHLISIDVQKGNAVSILISIQARLIYYYLMNKINLWLKK